MTRNNDVAACHTLHEAWTIVWGKSHREQCYACGKWTSLNKDAREVFFPPSPKASNPQDWSYDEMTKQWNQYWMRTLWCPKCYKTNSLTQDSYMRVGTPRFMKDETK